MARVKCWGRSRVCLSAWMPYSLRVVRVGSIMTTDSVGAHLPAGQSGGSRSSRREPTAYVYVESRMYVHVHHVAWGGGRTSVRVPRHFLGVLSNGNGLTRPGYISRALVVRRAPDPFRSSRRRCRVGAVPRPSSLDSTRDASREPCARAYVPYRVSIASRHSYRAQLTPRAAVLTLARRRPATPQPMTNHTTYPRSRGSTYNLMPPCSWEGVTTQASPPS